MLRLLTLFGLALTLLAAPAAAQTPEPHGLRVVSYNIRFAGAQDDPPWPVRGPRLGQQLAFLDADLIGLQEALPAQVADLTAALPGYDHYGVGRDDGVNGETTTLFWRRDRFEVLDRSSLWCSPTPGRPSTGWDAAYPRTVTRLVLRDRTDGGLLDVRNTHLDHVGAQARLECARLIAALSPVDPAARIIVMGDLNTQPDTPPYAALVGAGLRDARIDSPIRFGPTGTFNGFDLAKGEGEAPIDHILLGEGLRVLRYAVLTDSIGGKVISDHYPVVADLAAAP